MLRPCLAAVDTYEPRTATEVTEVGVRGAVRGRRTLQALGASIGLPSWHPAADRSVIMRWMTYALEGCRRLYYPCIARVDGFFDAADGGFSCDRQYAGR